MRKLTRYLFLLFWGYHTCEQTVSKCYRCILWIYGREILLLRKAARHKIFRKNPQLLRLTRFWRDLRTWILRISFCAKLLEFAQQIHLQNIRNSVIRNTSIYITCSCSRRKGWILWWTASKHENRHQEEATNLNIAAFVVQLKSSVLLSLWQISILYAVLYIVRYALCELKKETGRLRRGERRNEQDCNWERTQIGTVQSSSSDPEHDWGVPDLNFLVLEEAGSGQTAFHLPNSTSSCPFLSIHRRQISVC